MMAAHCKVLADEILADCSQNHQSAKINSPPKFPAIRYINGLVTELKQKRCEVECGRLFLPGLLFADDTSLFGEDVEGLKQSLMVLEEWCSRWGMKVNAEKSAIIHFRRKSCLPCDHQFSIMGEVIPMVSNYKYLGCH